MRARARARAKPSCMYARARQRPLSLMRAQQGTAWPSSPRGVRPGDLAGAAEKQRCRCAVQWLGRLGSQRRPWAGTQKAASDAGRRLSRVHCPLLLHATSKNFRVRNPKRDADSPSPDQIKRRFVGFMIASISRADSTRTLKQVGVRAQAREATFLLAQNGLDPCRGCGCLWSQPENCYQHLTCLWF